MSINCYGSGNYVSNISIILNYAQAIICTKFLKKISKIIFFKFFVKNLKFVRFDRYGSLSNLLNVCKR